MARCCGGAECDCVIVAGDNTGVTGVGTVDDPYVITSSFQSQQALDDHIDDPEGAHAASAISWEPSCSLISDNLQDVICEVAALVSAVDSIPAGTIIAGGWAAAPAGFLLCDGTSYTIGSQAALFAAIGYAYGGSSGNFNVPNLKGKVPVGHDIAQTEFDAMGETGGAKTVTLATTNLPSHTHTIDHDHANSYTSVDGSHQHTFNTFRVPSEGDHDQSQDPPWRPDGANLVTAVATSAAGSHQHLVDVPSFSGSSGAAGSGTAITNLQPYVVVRYAIKAV